MKSQSTITFEYVKNKLAEKATELNINHLPLSLEDSQRAVFDLILAEQNLSESKISPLQALHNYRELIATIPTKTQRSLVLETITKAFPESENLRLQVDSELTVEVSGSVLIPDNKDFQTIKKTSHTREKPVKIGITGSNIIDGVGDLAHILNVGNILTRSGVTEVIYKICWEPNDIGRIKQLVDKLAYANLISNPEKLNYQQSFTEIIKNINELGKGIEIFVAFAKDLLKLKIAASNRDVWISVSTNPLMKDATDFAAHKEMDYLITLYEHEPRALNSKVGQEVSELALPLYKMGIGYNDKFAKGLLLTDQIIRAAKERESALNKIVNPKFKKFLYFPEKTENLNKIVATTEFITAYPQYVRPWEASDLIIKICTAAANLKHDKSQFLVKIGGEFNFVRLISKDNQNLLHSAGFSQILYHGDDENIETIYLCDKEYVMPQKVLKLLRKCFFSEYDNTEFGKLTGSFHICSGDNTLQDAFSYGALPIFIPHFATKARVLANLAQALEEDGMVTYFPDSFKFLKLYSLSRDSTIKELLKGNFFTSKLIEEWPKICQYVIKNFNLATVLTKYVDRLEQQSDEEISPPNLLTHILKTSFVRSAEQIIEAIYSGKKFGSESAIEYAIERDIMLQGKTPLEYASYNGLEQILEEIIVSNRFINGKEAIYHAIANGIKIKTMNPVLYATKNHIELNAFNIMEAFMDYNTSLKSQKKIQAIIAQYLQDSPESSSDEVILSGEENLCSFSSEI